MTPPTPEAEAALNEGMIVAERLIREFATARYLDKHPLTFHAIQDAADYLEGVRRKFYDPQLKGKP